VKFHIPEFSLKFVDTYKIGRKSDKNNGHFTLRLAYIKCTESVVYVMCDMKSRKELTILNS